MNFRNSYRPSGFGGLPPVTLNLLIISVIMYVTTLMLHFGPGIDLNKYLALHHHLAPDFKVYQFITHMFMHASLNEFGKPELMHIGLNMLGLFMFGPWLEAHWGPGRFLIFYLVCGLGATVPEYLMINAEVYKGLEAFNNMALSAKTAVEQAQLIESKYNYIESLNGIQMLGASGALYGLLGGFGVLYPEVTLLLFFVIPMKAKWAVILFGAIELLSGYFLNDHVAHFAHLGGLAIGVILVLLWKRRSH